jgi:alkylation response protein AidB-like acyl-CoA dehydrogenase
MRDIFRDDHNIFREQVRRFIEREIVPHHERWEEEGVVPRDIWRRAGEEGLLCVGIPEQYGGGGGDRGHSAVMIEELARVNATAVGFTTHSEIVAHYLLSYGTEAQKMRWLPAMAKGEVIAVIAMSEPGMGSDLRAMRTSAKREGDHYIVHGAKTFITNGINADLAVTATKLNPDDKRLTLLCVESDRPGFSKGKKLGKIGLRGQDTAELFFDQVKVPVENRLGEENEGFKYLSNQLAWERLIIGIRAAASLEAMFDETVAYTRERKVFNQSVLDFQNSRFKLAEAKAQMTMLRVFIDHCLKLSMANSLSADVAAMAKLVGSEMQSKLLDEFLQLHGGYGFMSEYRVSRAWVDARVARIYGGTSEIMKEIIGRTIT